MEFSSRFGAFIDRSEQHHRRIPQSLPPVPRWKTSSPWRQS